MSVSLTVAEANKQSKKKKHNKIKKKQAPGPTASDDTQPGPVEHTRARISAVCVRECLRVCARENAHFPTGLPDEQQLVLTAM